MLKKLLNNIPCHFGLIAFRFAYSRTLNPHFYDLGIWGRVPGSPNQQFYLWRPQDTKKKSTENPNSFPKHLICIIIKTL